MDEQTWLTSDDPAAMLQIVSGKAGMRRDLPSEPGHVLSGYQFCVRSDRKLWLFSCAAGHVLARDPKNFANLTRGEATQFIALFEALADGYSLPESDLIHRNKGSYLLGTVESAARHIVSLRDYSEWPHLLRDIFGNPFRPSSLCGVTEGITHYEAVPECRFCQELLSWHDGLIPRLARTIYEERRFEDMPQLADALGEAGCENEDMLMHCRGMRQCVGCLRKKAFDCVCRGTGWLPMDKFPAIGPHARGCWVLDLLLGKE